MKTLNQIIDLITDKGIGIDEYKEDDVLCGYELNTYTGGGVNQIIFLDFRDHSGGDATSAKDFADKFSEYVETIDIDDEIDMNRQDPSYKAAFTLTQAVADFTEWKENLEALVEEIRK